MSTALTEEPGADELPMISGASSLRDGHYAPPPEDRDGKTWVRTSVLVQAEPKELHRLWRDVERAPEWHERIVSVQATGDRTAHWVMQQGDTRFEWDFEILADEPGRRIAWRSTAGEPESAGEVIFEPAPGGRGTLVTMLECTRLGKFANAWETLTGRGPKQAAIENLRHFKALAETGEVPRVQPQPHGDRGTVGGAKRLLYGEVIPAPTPAKVVTQNQVRD